MACDGREAALDELCLPVEVWWPLFLRLRQRRIDLVVVVLPLSLLLSERLRAAGSLPSVGAAASVAVEALVSSVLALSVLVAALSLALSVAAADELGAADELASAMSVVAEGAADDDTDELAEVASDEASVPEAEALLLLWCLWCFLELAEALEVGAAEPEDDAEPLLWCLWCFLALLVAAGVLIELAWCLWCLDEVAATVAAAWPRWWPVDEVLSMSVPGTEVE